MNLVLSELKESLRDNGIKYKFAAILPERTQDNNYWSDVYSGMENVLNYLDIKNVIFKHFSFDRTSRNSFLKACSEMRKFDPLGFIMAPVREADARIFLEQYEKPYVIIDDLPDGVENYITFIGQNSFKAGYLAGRLLAFSADLSPGMYSQTAILRPKLLNRHHKNRVNGFMQYFEENKFTRPLIYYYDLENAYPSVTSALDQLFNDNKRISGIYTTDSNAYVVADYLKRSKLKIPLVGYDCNDKIKERVQIGDISFTIGQRPEFQGEAAAYSLLNKIICNKHVKKEINVPLDIITRENLDFYAFTDYC